MMKLFVNNAIICKTAYITNQITSFKFDEKVLLE